MESASYFTVLAVILTNNVSTVKKKVNNLSQVDRDKFTRA